MALLTSELARIRNELGYNNLSVGAEPYIGYVAVFDQVIATYLQAGAATTSATTVTAASSPTPVTLVLASATGFHTGDAVLVDVDDRQERAILQLVSSTNATLLLSKAHSGTYPVTVEGGESIIREILGRIKSVKDSIAESFSVAGIKKVDEIEFFPSNGGGGVIRDMNSLLMYWRDELASTLGVPNGWRGRRGGGGSVSIY